MSVRAIGFVIALVAVFFCGFTLLYSTGIVGVTKKPNHIFVNPGCFCHGDSTSPSTDVWIQGPDSVAAGQTAMFRISIARDSSVAAGFNVATFFGSLGIYDTSETQLIEPNPGDSLELAHVLPKPAAGSDTISWLFYYRAPASLLLIDTIYASGNSVNFTGDPDGDHWNFAPNFLVHVTTAVSVADEPVVRTYHLAQNHPNPFNPETVIRFDMAAAGYASLTVYDMGGRIVRELVDGFRSAGTHEARFAAGDSQTLSSGIYFYRLAIQPVSGARMSPFVETKKMVLLK